MNKTKKLDVNTNMTMSAGNALRVTAQRQEILDFIAFEDSTSVIWPWAASADAIRSDAEKLAIVETMLDYNPQNGYDTDQIYSALDNVFGINPDFPMR